MMRSGLKIAFGLPVIALLIWGIVFGAAELSSQAVGEAVKAAVRARIGGASASFSADGTSVTWNPESAVVKFTNASVHDALRGLDYDCASMSLTFRRSDLVNLVSSGRSPVPLLRDTEIRNLRISARGDFPPVTVTHALLKHRVFAPLHMDTSDLGASTEAKKPAASLSAQAPTVETRPEHEVGNQRSLPKSDHRVNIVFTGVGFDSQQLLRLAGIKTREDLDKILKINELEFSIYYKTGYREWECRVRKFSSPGLSLAPESRLKFKPSAKDLDGPARMLMDATIGFRPGNVKFVHIFSGPGDELFTFDNATLECKMDLPLPVPSQEILSFPLGTVALKIEGFRFGFYDKPIGEGEKLTDREAATWLSCGECTASYELWNRDLKVGLAHKDLRLKDRGEELDLFWGNFDLRYSGILDKLRFEDRDEFIAEVSHRAETSMGDLRIIPGNTVKTLSALLGVKPESLNKLGTVRRAHASGSYNQKDGTAALEIDEFFSPLLSLTLNANVGFKGPLFEESPDIRKVSARAKAAFFPNRIEFPQRGGTGRLEYNKATMLTDLTYDGSDRANEFVSGSLSLSVDRGTLVTVESLPKALNRRIPDLDKHQEVQTSLDRLSLSYSGTIRQEGLRKSPDKFLANGVHSLEISGTGYYAEIPGLIEFLKIEPDLAKLLGKTDKVYGRLAWLGPMREAVFELSDAGPLYSSSTEGRIAFRGEPFKDTFAVDTARGSLNVKAQLNGMSFGDPEKIGRYSFGTAQLHADATYDGADSQQLRPEGLQVRTGFSLTDFKASFAGRLHEWLAGTPIGKRLGIDPGDLSIPEIRASADLNGEDVTVYRTKVVSPYVVASLFAELGLDFRDIKKSIIAASRFRVKSIIPGLRSLLADPQDGLGIQLPESDPPWDLEVTGPLSKPETRDLKRKPAQESDPAEIRRKPQPDSDPRFKLDENSPSSKMGFKLTGRP